MNSNAPIDRLDEIAAKVGARVPVLILDLRDQIMEAITAALEESQDAAETTQKGRPAVLSIPISVKWGLEDLSVAVEASVSVKTKSKATIELTDPNQPRLPMDGDDGEIPPQAKAAVDRIVDRLIAEDATATITVRRGHE